MSYSDADVDTVAQVICRVLRALDTKHFFCLTGGDQALWIALSEAGIDVVNCRSEQSATYMADGYARVLGKPSFVYGQAGPGTANVAGALAEPFWAQTPVVSLTSAPPLDQRYSYAYQEIEQLAMHGPVTLWSGSVAVPERAGVLLERAIRIAVGPPSGPVHLEIPGPMFLQTAGPKAPVTRAPGARFTTTAPQSEAVDALSDALCAAQRPVILAGRGAVAGRAWDEIETFAHRHGIPIGTTLGGKGAIDETHPLAIGVVGRYSAKVANDVVARADVMLAVGTRLGTMATNTFANPTMGCRVLHIDVDPNVLGNNYPETISVVGDAKLTLAGVLERLNASSPRVWTAWADEVRADVIRWRAHRDETITPPGAAIHPASVVRALRGALGPEDLVFADTGYMAAWAGVLYPVAKGGPFFHRAVGSLGWAFAASLGGALAAPERKVACVIGDGGFGYHVGDIETALRHGLGVTVVILNNCSLAFEYHIQKYQYGGRIVPQVNDFVDVDYAAVARSYGAWGQRVTGISDLEGALAAAVAHPGLAVLDVLVDKEAIAPVTVYDQHLERTI